MKRDAILVGDAGGTNVRFALAHAEGGRVTRLRHLEAAGRGLSPRSRPRSMLTSPRRRREPAGAAFGFAGVVEGDSVELLNRGWTVDLAAVARAAGCRAASSLVNDFFAMARSAPELSARRAADDLAPGDPDPRRLDRHRRTGNGFRHRRAALVEGRAGWWSAGRAAIRHSARRPTSSGSSPKRCGSAVWLCLERDRHRRGRVRRDARRPVRGDGRDAETRCRRPN